MFCSIMQNEEASGKKVVWFTDGKRAFDTITSFEKEMSHRYNNHKSVCHLVFHKIRVD